jgi:hypothetical protein
MRCTNKLHSAIRNQMYVLLLICSKYVLMLCIHVVSSYVLLIDRVWLYAARHDLFGNTTWPRARVFVVQVGHMYIHTYVCLCMYVAQGYLAHFRRWICLSTLALCSYGEINYSVLAHAACGHLVMVRMHAHVPLR